MATVKTKEVRNRSYVGKDFDALRSNLLEYARQYYSDKIQDLSDLSMGGLLLDFAALVGDNLTFYLDHQFSELDPETVVETSNIEKLLRSSGVPVVGASPSIVDLYFYVLIPSLYGRPRTDCLPIIKAGSTFLSNSSVTFTLLEDVDFNELLSDGTYSASVKPVTSLNGIIQTFVMSKSGVCVSGSETSETFTMSGFTPFRKITLTYPDVHEIVSVTDALGNKYYEVSALTEDVVYVNMPNPDPDSEDVPDVLELIPAPYRFTSEVSLGDRTTTLVMGGGNASTFDDDAIPDPSEFAIPMKYKKTFSRISVNPSQLISTKTLGISASDTTLTVAYRYGGGLSHNVEPNSVRTVQSLIVTFPGNPPPSISRTIRDSIEVNNISKAEGGDDAPTIDVLKSLIPSSRNSQERIVTTSDLLARVYTMPSNFGRVFRAQIKPNPNNPLSIQLHVVSRDAYSRLSISPDTLKINLKRYLNPYRMISDAIDILDMKIINLKIKFEVFVDPSLNKSVVLQSCIDALKKYFDIKNWQADQPIVLSEVRTLLQSISGIVSVNSLGFETMTGRVNNLEYSSVTFDIGVHTQKGFILTPLEGSSIFEVKYPDVDIVGRAI